MIEEGDRVMVCLSGGKDSYTLLDILLNLQQSAPVNFSVVAVNLDQKQPGFPEEVLPRYLESIGVEYKIVEENTYGIVKRKFRSGKPPVHFAHDFAVDFIPHRHRIGCNQNCIRASPWRYAGDFILKYVLRRQNEKYAT